MESLSAMRKENVVSEMEYEDEPMDVIETPGCDYYEEGEINSSDDEYIVTAQKPLNTASIFTRNHPTIQTELGHSFNTFDKDEAQKKLDRAKRFSLPPLALGTVEVHTENLSNLYRDLGIDKENERHYRFNAIHMRGTENMSTSDVLEYFTLHAPSHVEWINDVSCNIIWMDDVSAARALLNLSKRIKNLDKVHLNADPFEKDFRYDSSREEINSDDAVDAREIKTAIPPGFWRIGVPCQKSSFLLLRYATRSDKKQRNAEKNSEYYRKYGNPHYGNITGLISNSLRTGIKKSRYKGTQSNTNLRRYPEQEANKKNPWEELAYEWGETDKVEKTDRKYNRSAVKREALIPDLRISLTNKKERAKRMRMNLETNLHSSGKEVWESKSKVPKMKMYADDEEKRLEKVYEKQLQANQFKRGLKEDLRSRINKKQTRPRFKFRSEKIQADSASDLSSTENEYDDEDSGDWALEHYHDLRESLEQNKRQEYQRYNLVNFTSDSESDDNVDDKLYETDLSQRSPLQIQIENDEYYLKKN